LGKVLAAQGRLDKAIDLFFQAVQIQPDFAEAYQNLVMALDEKGMKDEAAQEFQQALRITNHGLKPKATVNLAGVTFNGNNP